MLFIRAACPLAGNSHLSDGLLGALTVARAAPDHTLVADTGAMSTAGTAMRAHVYQPPGIDRTFEPDLIGRETAYQGLNQRLTPTT